MSKNTKPIRLVLLVSSLGILSILSGALFFKLLQTRGQPDLQSLIVLPQTRIVADFILLDESARDFSLAEFQGRWSLLFFGFTSCPDICPNTLYQLQQVRADLAGHLADDELPIIYLVSVDPGRDTPEKLAQYLSYFDPAFKGLTGDDRQLRALTMQLGIAYHVAEHDDDNMEYAVDHSASLILLNPQAQMYGVFPAPHQAEFILHDLQQVIN